MLTKTLRCEENVWENYMNLKIKKRTSMNIVLKELYDHYVKTNKNGNEKDRPN